MLENRKTRPGAGAVAPRLALMAACLLAGCMGGEGLPFASRSAQSPGDPAATHPAPHLDKSGAVHSGLIAELTARDSILPDGSPFARVAESVLRAESGAARAELRVSRLTAKAKSKNWLPSIGPDVSLTSLGSLAASLVLDQAILDNGRRKAERDFAAADVEIAAVTLAVDLNQRVHDGLKHYIEGQRATELAGLTETALVRMRDFHRIVSIRVDGGLSDKSEFRIVAQKLAEMEALLTQEQEAADTAWAELAAMSDGGLDGVAGLAGLPPDGGAPESLNVLMARAEASRTEAEVRMARAGLMPGLGASTSVDKTGDVDAGLSLDGEGLGFGRKDSLRALEESADVSQRRIAEAEETSERRIVALEREIATLTAQEAQEAIVLAQMSSNLDLFTEQYRAGRRSLLELVGQFESLVARKRDHASLKYAIALARIEIAQERGVLVDGAAM
jgi:adhesin transport system outer membrane protein